MDALETYLSTIAEVQRQVERAPSWLRDLRQQAAERFSALGFPSNRLEDWRYTNVAPITSVRFRPANRQPAHRMPAEGLELLSWARSAASRLVFVDGYFSPQLSSIHTLPPGVALSNIAAAVMAEEDFVSAQLAKIASCGESGFVALNTAFLQDGAFLRIEPGAVVAEPIHLVFLSTQQSEPTMSHPRSLIVAERGSQATVVESYVNFGSGKHLSNAVTELVVGEGAVIEHATLARQTASMSHFATLAVRQGRANNVALHSFTLTSGLVRNDVTVELDGDGSECVVNGLFLGDGRAHIDNRTTIDHLKPSCSSQELYKGILDGHSAGIFNGRIRVRPAAQKTNARQTNKNLLLSPDAQINTNPQLEILADDVKCYHGSTIGQLDADALFYLRARGIDEDMARTMLTRAFANEMIERLRSVPLRRHFQDLVQSQLRATVVAEELS